MSSYCVVDEAQALKRATVGFSYPVISVRASVGDIKHAVERKLEGEEVHTQIHQTSSTQLSI